MSKLKSGLLAIASACALAAMAPAQAANISFTGNLANTNEILQFQFVVGAPSNVLLRTWSWAGGVNAAGDTIAAGGFDPILALFDSAGTLIDQNDDGGSDVAAGYAGAHFDTYLTASLAAGTYTVAVMRYPNFAIGPTLANGFYQNGAANFNSYEDGHWAFDIFNVEAATQTGTVPEPASLALVGLSLLAAGAASRRKKAA